MKMRDTIKVQWFVLVIMLLFLASAGFSATATQTNPSGVTGGASAPAGSQRDVKKSVQIFKELKNNILYTTTNTYNLTGVTVTDLTKGTSGGVSSGSGKLVDMTFIGGVLKEVVIRQ